MNCLGCSSGRYWQSFLESLLKKLLTAGQIDSVDGRKKAERKKRQELGQKQCTQLRKLLFELLMVVEEQAAYRSGGEGHRWTLTTIAVFGAWRLYPITKHLEQDLTEPVSRTQQKYCLT